jgi:peptidoglycan/LPS O-acetylase OafA/YrhL
LNPVMWTLVVEAQFYISLPLVFLALKKAPAKVCLWAIPGIFLAAPVTFRAVTGLTPAFWPKINAHFPSGLDAFFLGILVAGLDTGGLLKKKWARLGMIGVVLWPVAALVAGWTRSHTDTDFTRLDTLESWMEKIGSGCLLFYVANPTATIPRLLCSPVLRWCGIVSYEWYLFHQPIVLWARDIFGSAGGNIFRYAAIIGGPFLLSGILSGLVYRYFSLPLLRYGRGERKQ